MIAKQDVATRNLLHDSATMLDIPVAFVLFAVLVLIAANLWRRQGENESVRPFLLLLFVSAAQALVVGLRWDFGFAQLRIPQVLIAAALPPASWLVFRTAVSGRTLSFLAELRHLGLPMLIALALLFLPDLIDILLVASFAFYGMLFLRLALGNDEQFAGTLFEGMFNMRLAVWLLAFMLLGSALVDALVFIDFLSLGGSHAARMISVGNLAWLLALGISVALGSQGLSDQSEPEHSVPLAGPDDADLKNAEIIKTVLLQSNLIRDPSLNLTRLARRAGLPARAVSNAINRVHGCNVSQYINGLRINLARDLLADPAVSVTEAIYASGFQTKSNFNREFLRVTGQTPREWRKEN